MRSDSPDTLVWLPVSNAAGETIPAFAAMRVTGVDSDGIFTVAKPNADSAVTNIMFNGPVEIESGLYGHGTFGIPCSARYDTADGTPSNGDEWGVESGGWKLRNAKLGFKIQGSTDSSNGVATVVRNLDAAAAGGGLDLSGRSGSVADVTALQILRGVISGTAGAAVFTPDDASASLPGIVSTGTQTLAGAKTFQDILTALSSLIVNSLKTPGDFLKVWGTGATDPVLVTSDAGVSIGGSTNLADLECFGSATVSDEAIANARAGNYTSSDGALRVKSSETNRDTLRIVPRAKASGSLAYMFEEALEAAAVRGVFTIYGNVSAVEIITATNGAGVSAGSISMETALVSAFSLPCVHAVPITGANDLWIIFDAANNRFNFYTDDASPKLSMKGVDGVSGTGGAGETFTGGICTALGAGPTGSAGGDLGGSYPNPTVAQASGSFAFTGDISPAQLTANTNDWAPTGWS